MKLLATLPDHDQTTRYVSVWTNQALGVASKYGVNVITLNQHNAKKSELVGRIKKVEPEGIILVGHGSSDFICGFDDHPLLKLPDAPLLRDVLSYAISCCAAQTFGRVAVHKGSGAFIGYEDVYAFVSQSSFGTRPLNDKRAEPFMEASNCIVKAMLKGHSAEKCCELGKNFLLKKEKELTSSKFIGDWDASHDAQLLWWNRKNLVCHGNKSKSIRKVRIPGTIPKRQKSK